MALARMINLGDRYVELVHFGRGHTAGDVVVIVPDAQLIFTGDLLEQSAPPAMGADCYLKEWPAALDGVLGLVSEDTLLVPGHGEPVDRVFALFTQRAEISAVYGQVEHLIGQGVKLSRTRSSPATGPTTMRPSLPSCRPPTPNSPPKAKSPAPNSGCCSRGRFSLVTESPP